MKIKTIDPFDMTDKYAVTGTGAPSYTSAVHKWKGTEDNLKAKPVNAKINANTCSLLAPSNGAISLKFNVPVVPYSNDIPNSKIQDANADDNIIFTADSDDFILCRS